MNESIDIDQTYTIGTPYRVLGLIRFWSSQVKVTRSNMVKFLKNAVVHNFSVIR